MKSRVELKATAAKLFFENWFILVLSAAVIWVVMQIQTQVMRMQARPPEEHLAILDATPGFEVMAETLRSAPEVGLSVWQVLLIFQILTIVMTLLGYGLSSLALKAAEGKDLPDLEIFYAYKKPLRWLAFYFIYTIKVLLWSMLFIIPGIIAALNYSQAVFLMIEDESLSPLAAIKKSTVLMKERKIEYLIIVLSFFWFYVLAFFTMWVTTLYSDPYMRMTLAGYYKELTKAQSVSQSAHVGQTQPENV